jgi:MFS family permease
VQIENMEQRQAKDLTFVACNFVMDTARKIWNPKFILLASANFLMCVTYYAIISTLPIYLVNELKAGKSDVGLVLASYTIASIVVRPFGGFSLDKFGRRTVFLISLFLYSFFFCGYLLASSILLLIILRFMQGLTWGVTTIASSTIAVDIIPAEKRGEGIGYFGMSTTLGMSTGPIIGLFLYHQMGYTAVFVACIAASFISFVCASFIKLPEKALPENFELTLKNLFNKSAVLPSVNLLIIMSTYGGLLSFIALYGREIGVQNTSLFFLVFSIGIIISRFAAGKSFDKRGPLRILTVCLSLLMIGYPLLVIFHNPVGFYVSAIIIGFGIGVVFPIFQAMVNNLADPLRRGAANSTLYTALDIGMGAGMVVMGYIAEYVSISATFIVSMVIIAVGLIIFRKLVAPYYQEHINRKLQS